MYKKTSTLRGGGCGASRLSQNTYRNLKSNLQDIEIFINKFNQYVDTICLKESVAANQQESQEIMIAIQWVMFQEENIYQMSKDAQKVLQTYNLVQQGIRRLLRSCLIYIQTDQFKCFYILQITASLSKDIFSFHIMNDERFMKCELQKEFLDLSDELKQQIQIEKNEMIQVQMELYLFLTKTSFEIAPNNSNEREEILKGCLSGIISSITQMKPSDQLLESLFQGACLLYKMHAIYKIRICCNGRQLVFQKQKIKNLEEVLDKIKATHENLVKNSNNWMNHFQWIQMIGKILIYNLLLTKQKLQRLASSYNLGSNSNQIQSNDQAVLQLNQFQNKQLLQLDKIILEDFFKQQEQFTLLKDYLLNEENQNIHFTIRSYLQNKLKVNIELEEHTVAVGNIKKYFDFIISNKLLTLFKENYVKLGIVLENYRYLYEKDTKFNQRIYQTVQNQRVNNTILNLKEQIQNTQNILRILMLCSRKGNDMIKQHELPNELKNCQQLKYLMKLIEQILQSLIQGFKDKSEVQKNESYIQNLNSETEEIKDIQKELTKLQLKNSYLDDVKKKLLALLAALQIQKNLLKPASSLIQLISNSGIELEKIEKHEISSFQIKNLLIKFIENQLNNLNLEYYEIDQGFKTDTIESMLFLRQIIQIKYEIRIQNPIDMIKVVQLQSLKIQNEKELLHKLLQEIFTFSDNLDQIQSYEEEIIQPVIQTLKLLQIMNVQSKHFQYELMLSVIKFQQKKQ